MKRLLFLVLGVITLWGSVALTHAAGKFSDVRAGDWFHGDVSRLSESGSIAGYPDGTFKPAGTITRAEYTSIVARSLSIKAKDISGYHWSAGIMAAAEEAGLVKAGEFADVTIPITRYEMARMAVRALEHQKEAIPGDYADYAFLITDLSKSEAYKEDVNKVVAMGIITGYPDKTFQGLKTLTRAEASAVVLRIIDKNARKALLKPSTKGQIQLGETKPVTEFINNVTDLNKFNPNLKTVTLVTAEAMGLIIEKTPFDETMQLKAPGRTGVITVIKDGKTVSTFSGLYSPSKNITLYDTTRFPVDYKTIDYFGFFQSTSGGVNLVANPWKE